MGFVRITLILLTLLLWVAGSVFVGLAGYNMVEEMKFKGLTGSLFPIETDIKALHFQTFSKALDISLLGTACFIFIIGFFGCLGATLSKRGILKIFFALLAIFLVIQVALVVVYFVKREELEGLIKASWKDMSDEGRISIQTELNCCGMEINEAHASYNSSSCTTGSESKQTCFSAIVDWIKKETILIAASGCSFMFIEIAMLICTCSYIREISQQSTVVPLRMSPRAHHRQPQRDPRWQTSPQTQGMPQSRRAPQGFSRPPQPVYGPEVLEDAYSEDFEEEREVVHTRQQWARHNARQSWKGSEKRKPR